MSEAKRPWGGPEWLIVIGAGIFIFVLGLSAAWEADIRWLHFFQAWMYIAAIWLGLRKSRWGYFVGIAAAGTWDYMSVFVNTFFMSGLHHLASWVRTGHLAQPDQLLAIPAWGSNLIMIIGCTWGYLRLRDKRPSDLLRFAAAFASTTIFFAAAMAIFQPRYLPQIRGMLHPRWPRW